MNNIAKQLQQTSELTFVLCPLNRFEIVARTLGFELASIMMMMMMMMMMHLCSSSPKAIYSSTKRCQQTDAMLLSNAPFASLLFLLVGYHP